MQLVPLGCSVECPPINGTPGPVGPPGPQGPQGIPGLDGLNAFGITFNWFQMPPVGGNVTLSVNPAQWAVPTQIVYVMGVGYFQVAEVSTLYDMVLTNLGYPGSLAPGTIVSAGVQVSPSGLKGADGVGTLWFWGDGQPLNVSNARQGDLYLDAVSGDVYVLGTC
jgi:hypothetical protein